MAVPRIGYDNILDGMELAMSSEDASYPVERLFAWRLGLPFRPSWSEDLCSNGDFLLWAAGAAAAPDDWTHEASGGASNITRSTTKYKTWPYSAAVFCAIGETYSRIRQTAVNTVNARRRYYTIGCWCWCNTPGYGTIRILGDTAASDATSSPHSGGSTWEWLTAEVWVDPADTSLDVLCQCAPAAGTSTGVTAYFDGFVVMEGRYGTTQPKYSIGQSPAKPDPLTIRVYHVDGQLLLNWYFRQWTAGAAGPPDSWILSGAGASAVLDTAYTKIDEYSCRLTRAGANCLISQALSAARVQALISKQLSAGIWVRCEVATRACVSITVEATSYPAGGLTYYSAANAGGTSWEWLSATFPERIPSDVTAITIAANVMNGDTSAHFSGALACAGAVAAQTPHAVSCDYLAFAGHNLYSGGGQTVTLESSADNWATATSRAAITPTSDRAQFKSFVSASAGAWRIRVSAGNGASIPSIAVLAVGARWDCPVDAVPGVDWHHRKPVSKLSRSSTGQPLGRSIAYEEGRFSLAFPWLSKADITGAAASWWAHAGTGGKPFFVAHNEGTYPTDAVLAWCPDSAQFSAPLRSGYLVERFVIDCEAIAE